MPRAGLSRAAVVDLGGEIADRVGLERLTMAAVAERAGVRLPSLYKHVRGLDDLHVGIATAALHQLAGTLRSALDGVSPEDALPALAGAYRAFAQRHPARYAATLRAPDPDDHDHVAAAQEVFALVAGVLSASGLEGERAVHAIRIVRAALHGFVALDAAGGFRLPQDLDRTYALMVEMLRRGISELP